MVWVFRTSVQTGLEIKILTSIFGRHTGKHNWNFDLDDGDKILRRVSADPEKVNAVIKEFSALGFAISALE